MRRIRMRLLAVLAGAVALAAVSVLVTLALTQPSAPAASSDTYDAGAHRRAVEGALGHPVADWPAYDRGIQGLCATDTDAFSYRVALAMDDPSPKVFDVTRTSLVYRCSDRLPEWDSTAADLRSAP